MRRRSKRLPPAPIARDSAPPRTEEMESLGATAGAPLDAAAKRLVLTHISARYSDDPRPLEEEARVVFKETDVARDGMVLEIPYPSDAEAEPDGT